MMFAGAPHYEPIHCASTVPPRVLLLTGDVLSETTATGITLLNLFGDWPIARIAQIHTAPSAATADFCQRYWHVSPADVPVDRFVRRLLGKRRETVVGRAMPGLPAGLGHASMQRQHRIHAVISAWADLFAMRLPKQFWQWIDDFRPEVVYCTLATARMMNLAIEVSRYASVPIVPHFMDDWPTTFYRGGLCRLPRWALLTRIRAVLRRAPFGLAIGEAMAREYEQRYGKRFLPFMNCVEVPAVCPPLPARLGDHSVQCVYIGGLHAARASSLCQVAEALQELGGEGIRAKLVIFAPTRDLAEYENRLRKFATVQIGGVSSFDRVDPALLAADVLVQVESFDATVRRHMRLSVSTKTPKYLSMGRPILAFGPEENATCRYIRDCGAGVFVSQPNPRAVADAIRELIRSPEYRRTLGEAAWRAAVDNHHAPVVRERFRSALAIAATGKCPNDIGGH